MDFTIEMWTLEGVAHYAECTCGWVSNSIYQPVLESHVKTHKAQHQSNGDAVEIV